LLEYREKAGNISCRNAEERDGEEENLPQSIPMTDPIETGERRRQLLSFTRAFDSVKQKYEHDIPGNASKLL
jgi:hypothetical protein